MIKNDSSSRIIQNEAKRNEDDEATSTLIQRDIFKWQKSCCLSWRVCPQRRNSIAIICYSL